MSRPRYSHENAISVAGFRRNIRKMIQNAMDGEPVWIDSAREGCARLVLIREDQLPMQNVASTKPEHSLRHDLIELMDRMQTTEARKAAESVASASPEELGEAVLRAFWRGE